jgi:tRNA pseudouridine38-40 synthase
LDLAYDGTNFAGWATQADQRTVQGELERALATVLRVPVSLMVAGRTDSGVHATGQVAHLDVPNRLWPEARDRLMRQLAAVLPADVRVRTVTEVPAAFDARFSALWRRYEYRITDALAGAEPLQRAQVLAWPRPLDVEAMTAAAAPLAGLHDFAAFCKRRAGVPNATTIRTVQAFDVMRDEDLITFTIRADAFCHSMVRSLVGGLVAVGEGRRSPDWPASLLTRTTRADDVPVAPAKGLTLVAVGYPSDEELAARAAATRAVRVLPTLEP